MVYVGGFATASSQFSITEEASYEEIVSENIYLIVLGVIIFIAFIVVLVKLVRIRKYKRLKKK